MKGSAVSAAEETTWLTQEAFDRLTAELEQLSTVGRKEIAKKIEVAREEGDLKENGGYHAAKEEQGMMEARIRQIEHLLKTAEVREAPTSKGIVEIGTVITAKVMGNEQRFLLANREAESGLSDMTVFSADSPLGAAIMGLKIGDKTSYEAPNGREIEVEVIAVDTFGG